MQFWLSPGYRQSFATAIRRRLVIPDNGKSYLQKQPKHGSRPLGCSIFCNHRFIHQFALESNPPYPDQPHDPVMKVFYIRALYAAGVLSAISDRAYGGTEPDAVASVARTIDREVVKRQLRTSVDVKTDKEERMNWAGMVADLEAAESSTQPTSTILTEAMKSLSSVDDEVVSMPAKKNFQRVLKNATGTPDKVHKDDALALVTTFENLAKEKIEILRAAGLSAAHMEEQLDKLEKMGMMLKWQLENQK